MSAFLPCFIENIFMVCNLGGTDSFLGLIFLLEKQTRLNFSLIINRRLKTNRILVSIRRENNLLCACVWGVGWGAAAKMLEWVIRKGIRERRMSNRVTIKRKISEHAELGGPVPEFCHRPSPYSLMSFLLALASRHSPGKSSLTDPATPWCLHYPSLFSLSRLGPGPSHSCLMSIFSLSCFR